MSIENRPQEQPGIETKPSEVAEVNKSADLRPPETDIADQAVSDSVGIMSVSEVLRVYDKDGKNIFSGTPEQLSDFWKNNDKMVSGDIGGVEDRNGNSIIRFGAADGHGFVNRSRIDSVLKSLDQKILGKRDAEVSAGKIEEIRANLDLAASTELSPTQKQELLGEIRAVNKKIYFSHRQTLSDDLFAVSKGIDPETGQAFKMVDGDIGKYFDAHGLSKSDQLNALLSLLDNGVDPNRTFYTAPFELSKEDRVALGAALGTAGGTAYKDGIAVVTSGYKQEMAKDGIKHVFVNDVYKDLKLPLTKLYPQYKIHLLSEQTAVMEAEATAYKE